MKLRRWVWVGIVALVVMVLLSLVVAPQNQQQQGSTYSRAPSGYGAWYAYMEQQDLPIQRWQRPLAELVEQAAPPAQEVVSNRARSGQEKLAQREQLLIPASVTLMQINNRAARFKVVDEDWVARGNVVVLVGVRTPVSKAPFRSLLSSPVGDIKIETSRRENRRTAQPRLQDQYGMVVWEEVRGQGKIIYIATPHFAANAYQDQPGNFKFLAQLASAPGHAIFVDEYSHGYKDQDTIAAQTDSLASYLAKTPLLLLAIQAAVILLVLIWGRNQRLGLPRPVLEPTVDNSEAYIQALAAVLQKANCREFVIETIGKAEQRQVQRALGLGNTLLEPQAVIDAWVQQTGRSAAEMQEILEPTQSRRLSDQSLRLWLSKLQTVRRQLE